MDADVITAFGGLNNIQAGMIVIAAIIIFIAIIRSSYNYKKQEDLFAEINDIKDKHQARLWEYVHDILAEVEYKSYKSAEKILELANGTSCNINCGVDPKAAQLTMFALVLEKTLYIDIFEKIKTAIRINGFHDMEEHELNYYIDEKATILLNYSRKKLDSKSSNFPLLKGTEEQRFTHEDTVAAITRIVKKSKEIKDEELAEIKKLREDTRCSKFVKSIPILNKLCS